VDRARIAEATGLSRATIVRTLQRLGLARLGALEPARPALRYEWRRPGQLLHLDVKKLGRIGRIGHRITGDRTSRVRGLKVCRRSSIQSVCSIGCGDGAAASGPPRSRATRSNETTVTR
jgi:hypothetical protein